MTSKVMNMILDTFGIYHVESSWKGILLSSLINSAIGFFLYYSTKNNQNKELRKTIDSMMAEKATDFKHTLNDKIELINGVKVLSAIVPLTDSKAVKTVAYNLEQEHGDIIIAFGLESNGKPQLMITISKSLTEKGYHAGNLIRTIASEIKGGGGGQAFFASAGGSDASGLPAALKKLKELI